MSARAAAETSLRSRAMNGSVDAECSGGADRAAGTDLAKLLRGARVSSWIQTVEDARPSALKGRQRQSAIGQCASSAHRRPLCFRIESPFESSLCAMNDSILQSEQRIANRCAKKIV